MSLSKISGNSVAPELLSTIRNLVQPSPVWLKPFFLFFHCVSDFTLSLSVSARLTGGAWLWGVTWGSHQDAHSLLFWGFCSSWLSFLVGTHGTVWAWFPPLVLLAMAPWRGGRDLHHKAFSSVSWLFSLSLWLWLSWRDGGGGWWTFSTPPGGDYSPVLPMAKHSERAISTQCPVTLILTLIMCT